MATYALQPLPTRRLRAIIAEEMERQGLTQASVGRLIGCKQSYVGRILRGEKVSVGSFIIYTAMKAFNRPCEEFFSDVPGRLSEEEIERVVRKVLSRTETPDDEEGSGPRPRRRGSPRHR